MDDYVAITVRGAGLDKNLSVPYDVTLGHLKALVWHAFQENGVSLPESGELNYWRASLVLTESDKLSDFPIGDGALFYISQKEQEDETI